MAGRQSGAEAFKEAFQLLTLELSSARTKVEFFDCLFDGSNPALLDRVAPGFFSTVSEVLFDDLILTFVSLTDPPEIGGRANLTLARLVGMVDEPESPALRLQADELLCRLQSAASALRRQRNRRVAHRDLQTLKAAQVPADTPADLFRRTPLPGIGLNHFRDVLAVSTIAQISPLRSRKIPPSLLRGWKASQPGS
jgi:AbiU2